MKTTDFRKYAISKKQQNNIRGGNWRPIRNVLIKHYGTAVTHFHAEIETSFNPLSGQIDESNFITLTIEFADGSGEIFQIDKNNYNKYLGRIHRIFSL